MRLASFDPGKTTGMAVWQHVPKQKPTPIEVGELSYKELFKWCKKLYVFDTAVTVFVIENYRVRPGTMQGGYSHEWSSVIPAKVIGALEYVADECGIEVVLQEPSIKPVGYKILGWDYKKGSKAKDIHIKDAIVHGAYYFHKKYKTEAVLK